MTKKGMTKEQMEAVGLLSMGTFLEYFDLMLYVHMATLLTELFFPKTNPTVAQLVAATAFCTTYLLRPIGGFVIGRIGDKFGRKVTITLTTFVMASACFIMAFTPIYQEIGITATLMIILARALQGFSSLAEKMGAQLYMAETLKVPYRCVASGIMGAAAIGGGLFALVTASITLSIGFNWRYAFIFGAFVAVIGVFARLRLRETPEFIDYKRRIAKNIQEDYQSKKTRSNINNENNEKVDKKTLLAFFFTELHAPICFYVALVYLASFMKNNLGMTPAHIANNNLRTLTFQLTVALLIVYLVKKIHPFKIAIITALIFIIAFPFIPYWLANVSNIFSLLCLQCLIISFQFSTCGTIDAIQYKYFPIRNRFTLVGTTYGIASPLGFSIASFSLIPLTHYFGYYALWIVFAPAVVGYIWALYYFRKLEIENGCYYEYPDERPAKKDTAAEEEDFSYDLPNEYKPFKADCEYSTALLNKIRKLNEDEKRKVNIKLIEKAIVFCKKWHGSQMRKTRDEPFYSHTLAVAGALAEYYFKTDVIVAAILHDILEDTPCTFELIEKEFNHRIAEIVEQLSCKRYKDNKTPKITLEQLVKKLEKLGDHEALFIKEIDRLHNLDTAEGLSPSKQVKMAKESELLRHQIAFTADKLNIPDKIFLEQEMFKGSDVILKKRIGLFNS